MVLSFVRTAEEVDVARIAQSSMAINLQTEKGIRDDNRCRAYLIFFDAAAHHSESFIEVRVKVCTGDELQNVHVLATPIQERRTKKSIFNVILHSKQYDDIRRMIFAVQNHTVG